MDIVAKIRSIFKGSNLLTPQQYLERAAVCIETFGKCNGQTYDELGRVSVVGAIRMAIWGSAKEVAITGKDVVAYMNTKKLLEAEIRRESGIVHVNIEAWNDNHSAHFVAQTMRCAGRRR